MVFRHLEGLGVEQQQGKEFSCLLSRATATRKPGLLFCRRSEKPLGAMMGRRWINPGWVGVEFCQMEKRFKKKDLDQGRTGRLVMMEG